MNEKAKRTLRSGKLRQASDKAEDIYQLALSEMRSEKARIRVALRLLNESLKLGSAKAAYSLATWYIHGKPYVKRDLKKAVALLQQAASEKLPEALFDLAVCYEKGAGTRRNLEAAFENYLRAALRGDDASVSEVGRCYYYGIGIGKDRRLSDLWLERAEDLEPAKTAPRKKKNPARVASKPRAVKLKR